MDAEEKLDTTAARQHGLVTRRQVEAVGFDAASTDRFVAAGRLVPVRRGIYRLRGWPITRSQELLSLCLNERHLVAISHLTAADIHGIFTSDEHHVSVAHPASVRLTDARVHRLRDFSAEFVQWVDGVPVTTPARTLLDLGACLPPRTVERLVDHACAVGLVPVSALWRHRIDSGVQGRNGAGRLGWALRSLPEGVELAESGPEITISRVLAKYDLPAPVRQHPVCVGARRYRLDLAWPDVKLAVEYDGRQFHSQPRDLANDRRRQRHVEAQGWQFVRVRNEDILVGLPTLVRVLADLYRHDSDPVAHS